MKERPILFSGAMVRAILEGRKTQTRRVVKAGFLEDSGYDNVDCAEIRAVCPHGVPGDRLWVRETWATGACYDEYSPSILTLNGGGAQIGFAAGGCTINGRPSDFQFSPGERGRWRSSIHMPRWATRITLEIESVRVERVREISEADAIAEGMAVDDAVYDYSRLWDSINEKRGHGWAANPWVWVITFRRLPAS